ncbi:MAG: hypothetical protein JWP63_3889 [Candidatus Solibacter sp.]|nr:hypothetical protein [Candidatus Solibacter sp.]
MNTSQKIIVAVFAAACAWSQTGPTQDSRARLISYLDGIARTHLEQRRQSIAQIQTSQDADRRKKAVREKILQLIGGLPEHHGPVTVKTFGTLEGEGFRMEKVAYESLPGFWVTADVYLPAGGGGPFPAIVIAPGHGPAGKPENWNWGVNFARNGIAVLAYDPLGQGERLQYYDTEAKKSKVGNPTGEHGEANVQPMLIGDNVARYMVNDAMRGVDYLIARKDIDAAHIGAFGCSGGGTATAYFAALDDRVKAAASACYITSFQQLLASPTGVQDAEQSLPHFIEQGLDLADWVEVFAPKPYAIVSTQADMFPFEGARQTYEEAKRIYGLYKAEDRIQWITGPGGHGNLGPISMPILTFFTTHLKGSAAPPTFTAVRLEHREDVQCTPTGQVSTAFGGETVYSLNRQRAEALLPPGKVLAGKADLQRLQARLPGDIRSLTGSAIRPGSPIPAVRVTSTAQRTGYRLETLSIPSDGDSEVTGLIAIPESAGAKPAVLMLDSRSKEEIAAIGGEVDRLARAGKIVMLLEPRPTPVGAESVKSPYLGLYNLLSLRAFLVGKTIVGLRIDDTIRAMDWLCGRKDVDRSAIQGHASGALGIVLLHAAVLDPRIGQVTVENALASYRMIVQQELHRNVSEMVIPGVLRKYDTGDLLLALSPRPVSIVNPEDATGAPVDDAGFRKELAFVFRSDKNLGSPDRIRVVSRVAQAGSGLPKMRVILVGDSTVAPHNGWGPGFCALLASEATCVNLAKNGRSTSSYRAEGSWDGVTKALSDNSGFDASFVLIQFGHNDQPGKPGRSTDLATEFPANLRQYVRDVKAAGGKPVLITPLTRRMFRDGRVDDSLAPWGQAAMKIAGEEHIPVLDLNSESHAAVQKMGPVEANTLAMAPPPAAVAASATTGTSTPVPKAPAVEPRGDPSAMFDYTHLGEKGSAFFGRMVADELVKSVPAMRPYVQH